MKIFTHSKKSVLAVFLAGTIVVFSAFQSFQVNNTQNAVPEANFVNFETAHVHPMDKTPDNSTLLAVNTANNTLEVFQIEEGALLNVASIPVGLDPVTVRVRSNSEAWVVNQVSDNISIVDLNALKVIRSVNTENEPADVVFAGSPIKAYVSCAERESIQIFDPSDLSIAPSEILLLGEQPRAMAVSPDGATVYTAFFESGNQTTVIPGSDFMAGGFESPQGGNTAIPNDVKNVLGPYGGATPVPNNGTVFSPPLNPLLPSKDELQSLVVKKNSSDQWMDDNGGNWTNMVSGGDGVRIAGWDVLDNDVAVLNTSTNGVTYQKHLGNILMAMDVNPISGMVSVVGTDATNEIRFEPNLRGVFLRVNVSQFNVGGANTIKDLNTHLTYNSHTVVQAEREKSIGDPRAITWTSDGSKAYVSGMGSNNLITLDANGDRTSAQAIPVGEGPTGLVLDETRNQLYVLNKFSGTISIVDIQNDQQITQTDFFDPTPLAIKVGRKHLYNTHLGSGNGHISCGSCHVDGKWDRLAWDLGNPAADMEVSDTITFHPLKGLKVTQFLIDIIDLGTGRMHWRGDRQGFSEFAGAFQHLQGTDVPLDPTGMQEFEDYLKTTYHVPNPYRPYRPETQSAGIRLNPDRVRGPGTSFQTIQSVTPIFISINNNCSHCHLANSGRGNTNIQPGNENMGADLRTTYRKIGFWFDQTNNTSGFGLMSDGSFESRFNIGGTSDYFGDYEGEILAFAGGIVQTTSPQSFNFPFAHTAQDSHAAVGRQETLNGPNIGTTAELDELKGLADDYGEMAMVVKGVYLGEPRGFYYLGSDSYQSDKTGQTVTHAQLVSAAQTANADVLSWMLVHDQVKELAIDANQDGTLDGDEMSVNLVLRGHLQGADNGAGMNNDLIDMGLLPVADPTGSGVLASSSVMVTEGDLSPVDWMEVELRSSSNPATVVAFKSVMLLKNGNIVEADGSDVVRFSGIAPGDYYVAIRHRNHLGTMSGSMFALNESPKLLDFRDPSFGTFGTAAQYQAGGITMLWMGDVNGDGTIKYTGSSNDRDLILLGIGGSVPTNVVVGYELEDVNLDGAVKYTGVNNDRDPILLNIGGSVPTDIKSEQLP